MNLRSLTTLLLVAALAGCSAGSSALPRASASPLAVHEATVLVHFSWPARKTSAANRNVQYISPSTDHITIQNYYSYNTIAPVDRTIRVPFGTVAASIPAAAGYNYYQFKEWATATETGPELANAYASVYIADPTTTTTLDVALNLNVNNMGYTMTTDSGRTVVSQTTTTTGHAALCVGTPTNIFVAPLDGANNPVTGVGTPGLALSLASSSESRLTVKRTANTYSVPPYGGLIQYTLTANTTMSAGSGAIVTVQSLLNLNQYSTQQTFLNNFEVTASFC